MDCTLTPQSKCEVCIVIHFKTAKKFPALKIYKILGTVYIKNNVMALRNVQRWLGFKPIPECATLDLRVSDQGRLLILYTEFKWRIGVHFGQNAAKNNALFKKCFE